MKYFISDEHWDINGYINNLKSLEPRFSKRVHQFFLKHSFHDAYIYDIKFINRTKPLQSSKVNQSYVQITLHDRNGYDYVVTYKGVIQFQIDYDAARCIYFDEDKTCYDKAFIVHEWGYDELTAFDHNYLSHEILTHSEAIIKVIFKKLDYKRLPLRSKNGENN